MGVPPVKPGISIGFTVTDDSLDITAPWFRPQTEDGLMERVARILPPNTTGISPEILRELVLDRILKIEKNSLMDHWPPVMPVTRTHVIAPCEVSLNDTVNYQNFKILSNLNSTPFRDNKNKALSSPIFT